MGTVILKKLMGVIVLFFSFSSVCSDQVLKEKIYGLLQNKAANQRLISSSPYPQLPNNFSGDEFLVSKYLSSVSEKNLNDYYLSNLMDCAIKWGSLIVLNDIIARIKSKKKLLSNAVRRVLNESYNPIDKIKFLGCLIWHEPKILKDAKLLQWFALKGSWSPAPNNFLSFLAYLLRDPSYTIKVISYMKAHKDIVKHLVTNIPLDYLCGKNNDPKVLYHCLLFGFDMDLYVQKMTYANALKSYSNEKAPMREKMLARYYIYKNWKKIWDDKKLDPTIKEKIMRDCCAWAIQFDDVDIACKLMLLLKKPLLNYHSHKESSFFFHAMLHNSKNIAYEILSSINEFRYLNKTLVMDSYSAMSDDFPKNSNKVASLCNKVLSIECDGSIGFNGEEYLSELDIARLVGAQAAASTVNNYIMQKKLLTQWQKEKFGKFYEEGITERICSYRCPIKLTK